MSFSSHSSLASQIDFKNTNQICTLNMKMTAIVWRMKFGLKNLKTQLTVSCSLRKIQQDLTNGFMFSSTFSNLNN